MLPTGLPAPRVLALSLATAALAVAVGGCGRRATPALPVAPTVQLAPPHGVALNVGTDEVRVEEAGDTLRLWIGGWLADSADARHVVYTVAAGDVLREAPPVLAAGPPPAGSRACAAWSARHLPDAVLLGSLGLVFDPEGEDYRWAPPPPGAGRNVVALAASPEQDAVAVLTTEAAPQKAAVPLGARFDYADPFVHGAYRLPTLEALAPSAVVDLGGQTPYPPCWSPSGRRVLYASPDLGRVAVAPGVRP